MTVKQFKRRWLNSKVEPELFYLPFGKKGKEEEKGMVVVDFSYYNTFNVSTKKSYNVTGKPSYGISIQVIIKDNSDRIIYKSKSDESFILINDLPYGKYYVKVIKALGAIVDNQFHEITANQEYQFYHFYLPFHWIKVKKLLDNKNDYRIWKTGEGIDNFKLGYYFTETIITDDYSNEELARFPSPNTFDTIANKDGVANGRIYCPECHIYSTKSFSEISYSIDEQFKGQALNDDGSSLVPLSVHRTARFRKEIVSDFPVRVDENTLTTDRISWFGGGGSGSNGCEEYMSADRSNRVASYSKTSFIETNKNNNLSTEDESITYYLDDNNVLYQAGFEVKNAVFYYVNYKDSFNSIDENYFKAGNFIVAKFKKPFNDIYTAIYTFEEYQDALGNNSYLDFEKVPLYDSAFVFSNKISPDDLLMPYRMSCNYVSDNEGFEISEYGYKTYTEDTAFQGVEYQMAHRLPSYSDDYYQY